ncbi:putative Hydroxysteroid dehydrogenase-like protein 2 [Favolaschia claudopus]|uniref:Hydroxysteroid dehydrogenase-like protein 2 n=1 Tax=Favolaschia claudopus TaxID=2862362 RepID=A0AAW0EH29_9AGAR
MTDKKVAVVIGGSRGIGRQICIDLAKQGYAVVVAGKSLSDASAVHPFPPDPNSSQSTSSTVAREITEVGGTALALAADTRNPASIEALFSATWKHFGRLDLVIYNAGAIWWASVAKTSMRRFKLMQEVNVEGLYATVQSSLPYFERGGWHGRIIVVSPPIYSRFFRGKTAYAMGKVGMSVLTKGLAMDWQREGKKDMAITSIWPASAIESAATLAASNDPEQRQDLRHPSIFSDAILAMLAAPATTVNGLLDTDEDFLRNHAGVSDFSRYSLVPGTSPRRIMPAEFPSLEVAEQADEGKRVDSTLVSRRAAKL